MRAGSMATHGFLAAAIASPAPEASPSESDGMVQAGGFMGASDALTLGCCVLAIVALAGLFGTLRERR